MFNSVQDLPNLGNFFNIWLYKCVKYYLNGFKMAFFKKND